MRDNFAVPAGGEQTEPIYSESVPHHPQMINILHSTPPSISFMHDKYQYTTLNILLYSLLTIMAKIRSDGVEGSRLHNPPISLRPGLLEQFRQFLCKTAST